MIDFRYHLVSIIAIFLALAIGIVLGAGPLKEDIGTTLSSEVTKLRAEKADLNTQLSDAKSDQQAAMTYGAATLPLVVNGRLKGQTVALVAGPDSPTDLVDDVADAVVAAGGQVGPRVRLTKDMISTSGAQARSEQVASIAAAAKVTAGDAADLPAVLLARSVVSGGASAPVYDETFGPTVLPKLKSAGLLQYSEGAPGPATSSILVAGPVSSDSAEQTTAEQKSYLRIVGALDRVGRGAVAAAASTPAAATTDTGVAGGVIAAMRADGSTNAAVSTVDDLELPMGQAATIIVLQQQLVGKVGRYGLTKDAQGPIPALTP